eukprot:5481432-Pyramimonas_sp.AAC.1
MTRHVAELERTRDLHTRLARLEARNAELEKELESKLAEHGTARQGPREGEPGGSAGRGRRAQAAARRTGVPKLTAHYQPQTTPVHCRLAGTTLPHLMSH